LSTGVEASAGTSCGLDSQVKGTVQEVTVPVGTQVVQAIVSPPGGALKAYEMNVSSDVELTLQVEPQGGEVVVALGKSEPPDDRILAVWQDDIGIPVGVLASWTEGHGVRFRFEQGSLVQIPQLAPGNYTVCLGTAAMVASSELGGWKSRAKCASGYLAAASALDLRIP
jgi:hypothetical protein